MYEQDTDEIIRLVIEKLETEHRVSITATIAELKGLKLLQVEWTEKKGIEKEELETICAKITANYKDRYLYKFVDHPKTASTPAYSQCFVSKNPHYKKEQWYTKYPIRYDIFKGAIAAIFAISVSLLLGKSGCQQNNQLYMHQEKRLDSLAAIIDSLYIQKSR